MTSSDREELADLAARIRSGRESLQQAPRRRDRGMAAGLSLAFRVVTDMVVAVIAGVLAGRGLDWLLGSSPWATIVFGMLGMAAGIRNVMFVAERMPQQHAASPPPAEDGKPARREESGADVPGKARPAAAETCGNPSKDE